MNPTDFGRDDDTAAGDGERSHGGDDGSLEERLHRLHRTIEATASHPLDRETNRWLGEAEAVAEDAATSDLDAATAAKRLRQVRHLLDEAGSPDHEAAADRLEAAGELCEDLLAELSERR